MEYAALALAVLALIAAFAALAKAGRKDAAPAPDAGRSERLEGLEAELVTQRRLLAALAGGTKLTSQMVLEGRLWQDIDTARAAQLLAQGGLCVVDVRTPQETALGIIPGALLIPVDELPQRAREIPKDARAKLVYCAGGGRSAAACEFLGDQGFVELYRRSLALHQDPLVRADLARALAAAGNYPEAAVEYKALLAGDPQNGALWHDYGLVLELGLKDLRGAEDALFNATKFPPRLPEASYDLGRVLMQRRRYEEAGACFEAAISNAPPKATWLQDARDQQVQAYLLAKKDPVPPR